MLLHKPYFLKISSLKICRSSLVVRASRFVLGSSLVELNEGVKNAEVAQLVEQLICNQQVAGSTPVFGSGN